MKPDRGKNWMLVCAVVLTVTVASRASADQAATAAGRPQKSYSGTLVSVNSRENTLTAKGFLFSKTFHVATPCVCALLDNRAGTAYDLRHGERVTISYQDVNGVLVADGVKEQPLQCEGTAKSSNLTSHTLTVRAHGSDKTFQLVSGCNFVLRDERSGSLADIQTGNHVTVTYETPGGTPTAWQVAQTGSEFTGTLKAIDLEERTLKATSMFDSKKFNVGDDCVVVINGKPGGRLRNLQPDEKVVISYDEVDGVNVASRIAPQIPAPPAPQANSVASLPPTIPGSPAPMTDY